MGEAIQLRHAALIAGRILEMADGIGGVLVLHGEKKQQGVEQVAPTTLVGWSMCFTVCIDAVTRFIRKKTHIAVALQFSRN